MHEIYRLLIVEDNISRVDSFRHWCPEPFRIVWAKSAGVALGVLERDRGSVFSGILLDHDLFEATVTNTDIHLCGMDIAQSIITNIYRDVPILIHSMNHDQASLMQRRLNQAGFSVTRLPMSMLNQDLFFAWLQDICE